MVKYFDVPKITDKMRDDYNLLMAKAMIERSKKVIVDDRLRWQKVGGNIIDEQV